MWTYSKVAILLRLSAAGLALLFMATPGCTRFFAPNPTSVPPLSAEEEALAETLGQVPFSVPQEGPNPLWREARLYFFRAYGLQLEGRLMEAIEHYQKSIEAYPTAEAYTFLGWTYSWIGHYQQAIEEAQRAISLDPDFGNPYNDIGVYLMSLGKLDEAIPWLKRAMLAPRYASPHYPWLNLGNIWVLKGEWGEAASCYREVLRLDADYPVPSLPALPVSLLLPAEPERRPGAARERERVTAVLTQYFDAWNRYDADALKRISAPPTIQEAQALLMNLVAAERRGGTVSIQEIRVLHLEGDMAIATAELLVAGQPQEVLYLMGRQEGAWKVVIQLSPPEAPGQPARPFIELFTGPNGTNPNWQKAFMGRL